jgi:hypothetical protein
MERWEQEQQHRNHGHAQGMGQGGAPPYPAEEYQSLTGNGAASPPMLSPGLPPARREDERNPMEGRPLVGGRGRGRGDDRAGQGGGGGGMF